MNNLSTSKPAKTSILPRVETEIADIVVLLPWLHLLVLQAPSQHNSFVNISLLVPHFLATWAEVDVLHSKLIVVPVVDPFQLRSTSRILLSLHPTMPSVVMWFRG